MSFLSIAILITIFSLGLLIIPILKPRAIRLDSDNTNAAILKEQINELESDLQEGLISQEQFASAEQDLKLSFASGIKDQTTKNKNPNKDKIIGTALVAILVPLIGFVTFQEIKPEPKIASFQTNSEQPSIGDMIKSLEQKLEDKPDNVDGWIMLARSYDSQGNKKGAVKAYRKALNLSPNDSWIMAQLGYAVSEVSGSLAGEPAQLFTKALEIAPNNMDARFLLGKYHFQSGAYQKALDNWEYLLKIVNEKDAAPVRQAINMAKTKLGIKVDDAVSITKPTTNNATQNYVELVISLDPKIKGKVQNDATVFVYAQAKTGPKIPLAAKKIKVADLPATVRLDDSVAMMPDFKLSDFKEIIVSARISNSGNAGDGDYVSTLELDKLNQKVKIVISEMAQ